MKKVFTILILLSTALNVQEAASIDLGVGARIHKPVKSVKEIKTQNVTIQSLDFSCGPAALATLLTYYFEENVTEEEIIKYLLLTTDLQKVKEKKGFSLLDLKNFAIYKGYEVVGYKMDLEFLVGLNKPVLIPINVKDYSHFVIFRALKGDRVFLADPALGNMTIKAERFMKLWQGGIGLVLSKEGEENLNPPLKLTDEEKAVFADPRRVKQLFGTYSLSNIYKPGEF